MASTYLKTVSDCINNESGCKCDDFDKTSGDITEFKYENKPTFLKKSFTYVLVHWNEYELFDNFIWRMYLPKATLNDRLLDLINHLTNGPYSNYLTACAERMIIYIIYKHYLLQFQPTPGLKALSHRIKSVLNLMTHLNPNNIGISVKSSDIPKLRYISKMAAINCGFPRTVIVHNIIAYWLSILHRRIEVSMQWHTLDTTYKKWDRNKAIILYEKHKTYYEHAAYDIPPLGFIYERDIAWLTNRVIQK